MPKINPQSGDKALLRDIEREIRDAFANGIEGESEPLVSYAQYDRDEVAASAYRNIAYGILNRLRRNPLRVPTETLATLPNANRWVNGLVLCTDATGGAALVISDGTVWRRVSNGAVVS